MKLNIIPYTSYEKDLPQEGNYILGQVRDCSIILYQAFNDKIADYAIANQKFGGADYSLSRMTWIKPNFLWMMYRSGWAEKENQNRILAIEISISGFSELLELGVLTSYDSRFESEHEWRTQLNTSEVRIQWDPDHGPTGEKLKRRAVQIGIKGTALERFNNSFIKSVTDITDFVKEQKANLDQNKEDFCVIHENIVEVSESLKHKYSIPEAFTKREL